METEHKKPNPVVKYVKDHQTGILVVSTVTLTVVVAIQARGLRLHNDFLKEKGLYDEFYFIPEDVV